MLSVWVRTGQVQQVARGQNRRKRTNRPADNKRDNKRDNERGRARSRKTSRADKQARGQARERAQGRANRRPRDRGGRLAGAGAARGGTWARAVVARDAIRTRPQWRPLQKEARRRRRLVIKNRPRPQTGGALPMGRVAPLNGNGGGFRNVGSGPWPWALVVRYPGITVGNIHTGVVRTKDRGPGPTVAGTPPILSAGPSAAPPGLSRSSPHIRPDQGSDTPFCLGSSNHSVRTRRLGPRRQRSGRR